MLVRVRSYTREDVLELADVLLPTSGRVVKPWGYPKLPRPRHHALRIWILGDLEERLHRLLLKLDLVHELPRPGHLDLALHQLGGLQELETLLFLEALPFDHDASSLLDELDALHVVDVPGLLPPQGAHVHPVTVAAPHPLDVCRRTLYSLMAHSNRRPPCQPNSAPGLDLRHDLAEEGSVQDQRPELLPCEHSSHPRLDFHGGAVTFVRGCHGEHELFGLALAHLLHA
mmetsp:Transcript_62195/g.157079  ORF Transcript_62195/g.157079 Transcript_62195/m.157079 type:complete len:229 (-) Transcript_62195:986-1672(-)